MPTTPTSPTSETIYVCQQCPFGCVLKVALDNQGAFVSVSGNTCERGEEYARLRTQGLTDDQIHEMTGTTPASEKPKHTGGYSAYRKRKGKQ